MCACYSSLRPLKRHVILNVVVILRTKHSYRQYNPLLVQSYQCSAVKDKELNVFCMTHFLTHDNFFFYIHTHKMDWLCSVIFALSKNSLVVFIERLVFGWVLKVYRCVFWICRFSFWFNASVRRLTCPIKDSSWCQFFHLF